MEKLCAKVQRAVKKMCNAGNLPLRKIYCLRNLKPAGLNKGCPMYASRLPQFEAHTGMGKSGAMDRRNSGWLEAGEKGGGGAAGCR